LGTAPIHSHLTDDSRFSYGEATGITQTIRNYGASLGFAVLGTVLITEFRSKITASLAARSVQQEEGEESARVLAGEDPGAGLYPAR
jgi:hypothetical protein